MKILQLPDLNNILRIVKGGVTGVPIVNSDPGDKIPGIYEQLFLDYGTTVNAAAAYYLYSDPVPAGTIWWVQAVNFYYGGTVTGRQYWLRVYLDAAFIRAATFTVDATSKGYTFGTPFFLLPGYQLCFTILNAELNQVIKMNVLGVTMQTVST